MLAMCSKVALWMQRKKLWVSLTHYIIHNWKYSSLLTPVSSQRQRPLMHCPWKLQSVCSLHLSQKKDTGCPLMTIPVQICHESKGTSSRLNSDVSGLLSNLLCWGDWSCQCERSEETSSAWATVIVSSSHQGHSSSSNFRDFWIAGCINVQADILLQYLIIAGCVDSKGLPSTLFRST